MKGERTYWFRQRRIGFGATPDTWQGWTVSLIFIALLLSAAHFTPPRFFPWLQISIVVIFTWLCWYKTKGGWQWRGRHNDAGD